VRLYLLYQLIFSKKVPGTGVDRTGALTSENMWQGPPTWGIDSENRDVIPEWQKQDAKAQILKSHLKKFLISQLHVALDSRYNRALTFDHMHPPPHMTHCEALHRRYNRALTCENLVRSTRSGAAREGGAISAGRGRQPFLTTPSQPACTQKSSIQ
jgi:hypothetical protein